MRVSINWLRELVDLDGLSEDSIAQTLTSIGLEVEAIEQQKAFTDDVVVGRILTAVKHPNADSLRLTTVDIGDGEPLAIVCGAPNAREGICVAVAKVGASLPGDFKIKKSKIRGETSSGMLCSEEELGIGKSDGGIMELKADLPLGSSVAQALGMSDAVLTLNVTPNRADCLGHLGVARDLAAKLGRTLTTPQPALLTDASLSSEGPIDVKIDDAEATLRFVALYMTDIKVIESPEWLKKRLAACGMRPINLVVDATNYAMLEFGQPVHAYDLRAVKGGVLHAKVAQTTESFTTLDGAVRRIEPADILICDRDGVLGLAGIMGGQASEVKSDTTDIAIEVASFSGRLVRRTARRLGLHTEASHRFERGTDIFALPLVARRVASLIQQGMREAGLQPARAAADYIDKYPAEISKKVVAVELERIKKLLGNKAISRDQVHDILTRLGFSLLDENAQGRMLFEVPFHRVDIDREVDLIEEVARIHGFEQIPTLLPVMSIKPLGEDPLIDFAEAVRRSLAAFGLRETISFPFVGATQMQAFQLSPGHPCYPSLSLANPLSEEENLLQTSLVPGLLMAIHNNRRLGQKGSKLFECGRAYHARPVDKPKDLPELWRDLYRPSRHYARSALTECRQARPEGLRPVERSLVAAVCDQPYLGKSWNQKAVNASFYEIKSLVLRLLSSLGIAADSLKLRRPEASELPFLHPGASAVLFLGAKAAGYFGELHPRTASKLDLVGDAAPVLFELDIEQLLTASERGLKLDIPSHRFPPVSRDVAFLVNQDLSHERIMQCVQQFKKKRHLKRSRLFDVYEDPKLPAGKKSLAYSFDFQSDERTLLDAEVDEELSLLQNHLKDQLEMVQR